MLRRVITILVSLTAIVFVPVVTANADAAPPAQVLSNFENYFGSDITRDCGYSQPVPGESGTSLWLFCDTPWYGVLPNGTWGLAGFITGSTAAEGPTEPGEVPTDLSELTSVNTALPTFPNHDGPEQFLPPPTGLVTSSGTACGGTSGSYPARWISGLTQDAADPSDLLISFDDYCVQGAETFLAEGYGLAVYDPETNQASIVTVFSSPTVTGIDAQEDLGSPVFSGNYLYLFNYVCPDPGITCPASPQDAVYAARVSANPADWDTPADYHWFAGSGAWSSSPGAATSVIPGVQPLGGISAGDYASVGEGFALITQTSLGGGFTVYTAKSPAGPWKEKLTGTVPCASGTAGLCHAIIGHPDLSTSSSLLVSFWNPGAAPEYAPSEPAEGHVEVAAFTW